MRLRHECASFRERSERYARIWSIVSLGPFGASITATIPFCVEPPLSIAFLLSLSEHLMDETLIGTCPESGDSPLSWAGNLSGLLTFALGIFVTCTALLAATRNAGNEIKSRNTSLKRTKLHISRIRASLNNLTIRADEEFDDLAQVIRPALDAYDFATTEMEEYMERFEAKEVGRSGIGLRWIYIKWWYQEKETAAGFSKLESCSRHLTAAQLTFVQRQVNYKMFTKEKMV